MRYVPPRWSGPTTCANFFNWRFASKITFEVKEGQSFPIIMSFSYPSSKIWEAHAVILQPKVFPE